MQNVLVEIEFHQKSTIQMQRNGIAIQMVSQKSKTIISFNGVLRQIPSIRRFRLQSSGWCINIPTAVLARTTNQPRSIPLVLVFFSSLSLFGKKLNAHRFDCRYSDSDFIPMPIYYEHNQFCFDFFSVLCSIISFCVGRKRNKLNLLVFYHTVQRFGYFQAHQPRTKVTIANSARKRNIFLKERKLEYLFLFLWHIAFT